MTEQPYDKRYTDNPSYWGDEPTTIARRFVEQGLPLLREQFGDERIRIADLGCGDGRDALFYARQGLYVEGVDLSQAGIAALNQKAVTAGLTEFIEATVGNIETFRFKQTYHAIVSSGTLHHLSPSARAETFTHYKQQIVPGGLFAASVMVEKPLVERAPDADSNVILFRSGELLQYLWDWEILWFVEEIRPCNSGGEAHRHAVNRVLARRPA